MVTLLRFAKVPRPFAELRLGEEGRQIWERLLLKAKGFGMQKSQPE